jgi:hypothetical protein
MDTFSILSASLGLPLYGHLYSRLYCHFHRHRYCHFQRYLDITSTNIFRLNFAFSNHVSSILLSLLPLLGGNCGPSTKHSVDSVYSVLLPLLCTCSSISWHYICHSTFHLGQHNYSIECLSSFQTCRLHTAEHRGHGG